jgi:hypothetical protein
MAGRGPAPKPEDQRARGKRSNPQGLRVIQAEPTDQPELPTLFVRDSEGEVNPVSWPAVTVGWWEMWARSPLSAEFTDTDWSELRDTARLHALFWMGDKAVAGELRLRVAKFGATPEDRARLRITFAAADEAEDKPHRTGSARDRYKGLKAVDRDVAGA